MIRLPARPTIHCKVCGERHGTIRELWFEVGAAEIGVRAPLCDTCAAEAPERIRAEFSSPIVRSLIAVAGAKLGLKGLVGTGPAARRPG